MNKNIGYIMKKISISLLMLFAVITQATEMAFVNMETVFSSYYKTVDAEVALKKQRESIQEIGEQYKTELENLIKQGKSIHENTQNIMISKEQRDKAAVQLNNLKQQVESKKAELMSFGKTKGQEIKQRYEESRDAITEELIASVAKVSKRLKYDIVFDISGKTLNGIPAVIYYDPTKDITEQIVKYLNTGHEEVKK